MKIRNGFVSNSSSSSFVLLLPLNYDLTIEEIQHEMDEISKKDKWYRKPDPEKVLYQFKKLKKYKSIGQDDNYESYDTLIQILDPFIIATVEGGPDDGSITLANRGKVRSVLNIKIDKTTEE